MGLGISAGSSLRPAEVITSELQYQNSANESNVARLLLPSAACFRF